MPDLLQRLSQERGFYVPSFYEPQYGADGTLTGYAPAGGVTARRCRCAKPRSAPPTRSIRRRPASSRPRRSSDRGSSSKWSAAAPTCAGSAGPATTTCRCVRFQPTGSSQLAEAARPHASRVGLVSIALCDHPEIERILARLLEMGYGISPASLRLDDLTEPIVRILRESGERSITIAPETGSDRLRRVINKTVTNDEILDRAELIFASGIENLKLYYMIGLPTETDEDLVAIRDLTIQMRERMVRHARGRGQIGRIVAQRQPADSEAGHRLPVDADGGSGRDRPQNQAARGADPVSTTSTSTSSRSGTRIIRRSCRSATAASPPWSMPRNATARTGAPRLRRQASTPTSSSSVTGAPTPSCPGTSSTAA